MLTLGSLFDGIGGFPLAAVHNGIVPLWASEIEKFPQAVTEIRFPEMVYLGDITKINGGEIPPVDIITGGSPCQDLSVAGLRAGLAGERSGLFMDQMRIVKEMRDEDRKQGRANEFLRPRYMVWENVPGAFSSCGGEDFRAVLEEICRIADGSCAVPGSDDGKWESAGAIILGDQFSLAWRCLDAQFWGLAQRRKRIFLVADFGGQSAPEILFNQDSLCWDFTESRRAWENSATTAGSGVEDSGRNGLEYPVICLNDQGGQRMDVYTEAVGTLRASMAGNVPMVLGSTKPNAEICENLSPTLTASSGTGGGNAPLLYENHRRDCRYHGPLPVAPTLMAHMGTGGNNVPIVSHATVYSLDSQESNSMKSLNPFSGCRETELARTLDTSNPDPSKNQGGIAILQESQKVNSDGESESSICIAGNIIGREAENGGNGFGYQEELSYTLTATDQHAVLPQEPYQTVVGSLCRGDEKGISNQYVSQDKCVIGGGTNRKLIRRLTPLECERLQGFPDGWTEIPKCSDSARYKALGNSVAIPCVDFVLRGIGYFLRKQQKTAELE